MYQLKYYKKLITQGHTWRVEIYQEADESLQAVEIGPVIQGLRLIVQGDQADIDTPIVKTSLEMVFVDAPDLEEGRKCGYWEEFFTSSATEYKVILYKDGVAEWSGYVTPDSFSESLQYRGSVSIIARDNLGALQDYEYNATTDDSGLISLRSIIEQGMEAISFPMSYAYGVDGERNMLVSLDAKEGDSILDTLYNNSAFYEKNWREVVEEVLYATGLAMRYCGGNRFIISSLRDLPMYDHDSWSDVPVKDTFFCAYGQRELSPAVKRIIDEVKFDITEDIIDSKTFEGAYGQESTYSYGSSFSTAPNINMPIHAVQGGLFRGIAASDSILLNPFKYDVVSEHGYGKGGDIHNPDIIYVAANTMGVTSQRRASFTIDIPAGTYKISFEVNKIVALYNDNTQIGYIDSDVDYWRFGYEAVFTGSDGSIKTLNNRVGTDVKKPEWQIGASNGYHSISGKELPVIVESPDLITEVDGTLVVRLMPADLPYNYSEVSKGGYMGIANLTINAIDNSGYPLMETLRVKTEYNEKNNVVLTRQPKFAPNISNIISPKQIQNAIYVHDASSEPIGSGRWTFGTTESQLSVVIHQQILSYYASPNNILTGELATEQPSFNALYQWNGKQHMLMSGSLNIVSGRMENAVLRSFAKYSDLWETHIIGQDTFVLDNPQGVEQYVTFEVASYKKIEAKDIKLGSGMYLLNLTASSTRARITIALYPNFGATRTDYVVVDKTAKVTITRNGIS